MAKKLEPAVKAHLEWLGFVQPAGLVVSAPALVRAGAILNRHDAEGQRRLRHCVEVGAAGPTAVREETPWYHTAAREEAPRAPDFGCLARQVLGWSFSPKGYAGTRQVPIPPELEVVLPEYGETLRPDFAVREMQPPDGASRWQLLVKVLEAGQDFDRPQPGPGGLEASPHGRLVRLLRRTAVPAGLLFNGQALRLLSAPHGESSGWLDFRVEQMLQTAGRPIAAAMRLLLSEARLLTLPRSKRLAALLEESRKFQNEVSESLAEQVLHALYELLRGFQAANAASGGELLRRPLAEEPDEVYRGLLTVILRLVFLLYAEERDMLPEDETFLRYYSLAGLHRRLREDAALFPDTMDQRYGAWAQLLVLFRMVHDGARCASLRLPPRHGVLFDPDRFPFLEGRAPGSPRQVGQRIEAPLVGDGTIYRALEKLLVLKGERLSYGALDVEQIGSVYETMMGFRLEIATGPSAAIKAQKSHGAPSTVNLEVLLEEPPARRRKWLRDHADRKLTPGVSAAVSRAESVAGLHAALEPVLDRRATPDLVPPGAMILQPSQERRRSGSHYTPRSLTEPIVRTTLEPILAPLEGQDGRAPKPAQILELKICDPAMGSGAFLVEACRHLGDKLVEAWHTHDAVPDIPPDEDEVVMARRLVAQRCLYGVDRNPVAVDLAKVSLWLVTLAKDHALTFVDHALRHGDSLVGLSVSQIEDFDWRVAAERSQLGLEATWVRDHVARAEVLRRQIRRSGEEVSDSQRRDLWDQARYELSKVRLYGDLVVAAFFEGTKTKERTAKRQAFADAVLRGEAETYQAWLAELRHGEAPLAPFHWEVEFPEVFERENPGFDAIVGNPPFGGKNTVAHANAPGYAAWLKEIHAKSHGNSDLVAHFFRRAFHLIRGGGAFGLIATNTIAQGDTRATGLRWICTHGGEIFCARKRLKWPGSAAVVVSVVHIMKGAHPGPKDLDGRQVDTITAFLVPGGGNDDPARLAANQGQSFQGSIVLGMGFTFDDTDTKGIATPIAEMERLLAAHPDYRQVILPYIGGREVNSSPTHDHHRYVINFGEGGEEECRRRWPELMAIVEAKVKPERMKNNRRSYRRYWCQYAEKRVDLYAAIADLDRVLVISRVGQHAAFTFLPAGTVFSESLVIFPFSTYAAFCALQARPHEIWARRFGSSMKDDLRYTPSDCFETFPFPPGWETHPDLEAPGQAYYEFRARLMVEHNQGLTKTYNRFHDPAETDPAILKLRELHAAMDQAMLAAYGWSDIPTACQFLLDYDIDEETWSPRKKKPLRYRWPDEIQDEVLARLLELNAEMARQEASQGKTTATREDAKFQMAGP